MIGTAVAIILVTVAAVAVAMVPQFAGRPDAQSPTLSADADLSTAALASVDGSMVASADTSGDASSGIEIEVPSIVGKSVKIAEAIMSAAGFTAQTRVADPPVAGVEPDSVVAQWPAAGALVPAGSAVVITYQPRSGVAATAAPVVVIDAGHQQVPDTDLEPIGPGSKTTKPKAAGGATGVATQQAEYALTLTLAELLREELISNGVNVVMVRTTNAVDIPNSKRARVGNRARADLVVRIHCDAATDSRKTGVAALYPSGNRWTRKIEASSAAAATAIERALAASTGAVALGTYGRSDMSGFNYSTRPTVMVLCGFLSNADEDRKLAEPAYQARVVDGLANGVIDYLRAR